MTPYEQLTDRHPLVPRTGLGRRFPHQRVFVVAALFALVVALGAVSVRPVYRQLKLQRARQLAQEVTALVDAGAGTNALPQVRVMLGLMPDDEAVLRAAARFSTSNQHPSALAYWEQLLARSVGSREDRLAYAGVAVDQGRYEVATRLLGALMRRPGGDSAAARQALRLALKRSHWELAVRLADHVLELTPGDLECEVWRAQARLRSPAPDAAGESRGPLFALLFQPGEHWRECMDALLELPDLSPAELSLLRHRVNAAAVGEFRDRLRLASIAWLAEPAEREALVHRWVEAAATETVAANRLQMGHWLLLHGAAEPLLARFPLSACRDSRENLTLHALALARLGRWGEVADVAAAPGSKLDLHLARVLAVTAANLQAGSRQQQRARAVLAERNLQVSELLEAVQLCTENGLPEAAIHLLEPLLEVPTTLPEAANRILQLSSRVESLALRRQALTRLLHHFPQDALALQQLGYVEAILPEGNLAVITRLERVPGVETNAVSQMVLALGEIRSGRHEDALARLNRVAPADEATDYRVHLAYAAALGATGNYGDARRHGALAAAGPLQLEEKAFIRTWMPVLAGR